MIHDAWYMIYDTWYMIHVKWNVKWYMIHDTWYMIYHIWNMIYDIWDMLYDIWYMIHDTWYMIYDIWNMIYDIWYMIYDIWKFKNDIWYMEIQKWYMMTFDLWFMISDLWFLILTWCDFIRCDSLPVSLYRYSWLRILGKYNMILANMILKYIKWYSKWPCFIILLTSPSAIAFHCCSVWQLAKADAALTASRRRPFCSAEPWSEHGMVCQI